MNGNGKSKLAVVDRGEPEGKNFRELVERMAKDKVPDPVDCCTELGISHASLSQAMDGLGNNIMLQGQVTFADLARVLVWGMALGYYYREKQIIVHPSAPKQKRVQ